MKHDGVKIRSQVRVVVLGATQADLDTAVTRLGSKFGLPGDEFTTNLRNPNAQGRGDGIISFLDYELRGLEELYKMIDGA